MRNITQIKKILKLILLVKMVLISKLIGQIPNNDPTWKLIFVDEFDGSVIDDTKWRDHYPWNQRSFLLGCGNDTVQTENIGYRTWDFENCELDTTSSGTLSIVSKEESYYGKVWDSWVWDDCFVPGFFQNCPVETWENFNYTTGMLMSRDFFKYGYFEIKCKLPVPENPHETKGLGPNFWLFGANCGTSAYSEIDIFEFAGEHNYYGIDRVNMYTCNTHFRECNTFDQTCTGDTNFYQTPFNYGSVDFTSFQLFSAEWSPKKINFYIDNALVFSYPQSFSGLFCPLQIIIDINHPTNNFCDTAVSQNTLFPYIYEIDYVKVWQLNQYCDSILNICSFNPSTFDFSVYKSITIGGTGCSPTISAGRNVTLRATDEIVLDKGFSVELGAVFTSDIVICEDQEPLMTKNAIIEQYFLPPTGFIERKKY